MVLKGRCKAAAPTPSAGMIDPSEKDKALVGSGLVSGVSCDCTKSSAARLSVATRARICECGPVFMVSNSDMTSIRLGR